MRGLLGFAIFWLGVAVSHACRGLESDPAEGTSVPPAQVAAPAIGIPPSHIPTFAPTRSFNSCGQPEPFPTLDCTVLVDAAVPMSSVTGTLVQHGGRPAMRYEPAPGRFQFAISPGGTATLVIYLKPMRFELERVEGIELPSFSRKGKQMDPIDLRGRIRSLEARFVDEENRPLACALVHIDDGAGHRTMTVTSDEGWISVLVPRELERLPARVRGYRPTSFGARESVHLVPE